MKLTFTASLRGKKFFEQQYKTIYNEIIALGHEHVSGDIIKIDDKMYTDLNEGGREANLIFYKKKIDDLSKSDACIFECSAHSLSIGFLVQKSLDLNKPTIVLYYKDNNPEFLSGINDDKLIIKSYDDSNLKSVLEKALLEVENIRDKRFNFFISPQLLLYLEIASKKNDMTKSTFLRKLILEHRKNKKP